MSTDTTQLTVSTEETQTGRETGVAATRFGVASKSTYAFLVIAVATFVYTVAQSSQVIFYDAQEYWNLSGTFVANGDFELTNYPRSIRGYAFPLLLYGLRASAEFIGLPPLTGIAAFNAICMSLLYTVVLSKLWTAISGRAAAAPAVWITGAVGVFLWRGNVAYPLTDLPALTALAGGLVCTQVIRTCSRPSHVLLCSAAVGTLGSAALIFRPAFLLASIAMFAVATATIISAKHGSIRLMCLTALLVASAAVLTPQVLINRHHYDSWSPLVRTEVGGSRSLFLDQLGWGVEVQRYETNVSKFAIHAGTKFLDPVGTKLMLAEQRSSFDSMGDYALFVMRHPFDLASIYTRHVFNGLDILYPTGYVYDTTRVRWGTWLLNVAMWMLVLVHACRRSIWSSLQGGLRYVVPLLLPAITAIPTAVETRFFWPLHLLATGIAVYSFVSLNDVRQGIRQHWQTMLFGALLWVTLSRGTFATLIP